MDDREQRERVQRKVMEQDVEILSNLVNSHGWKWFIEEILNPKLEQLQAAVMAENDPVASAMHRGAFAALQEIKKSPEVSLDTIKRNLELAKRSA